MSMTYRERMCMAKSKLPHPAPRAEDGFKYKPCPCCGSSCWMADYHDRDKLICGDCHEQYSAGEIYIQDIKISDSEELKKEKYV